MTPRIATMAESAVVSGARSGPTKGMLLMRLVRAPRILPRIAPGCERSWLSLAGSSAWPVRRPVVSRVQRSQPTGDDVNHKLHDVRAQTDYKAQSVGELGDDVANGERSGRSLAALEIASNGNEACTELNKHLQQTNEWRLASTRECGATNEEGPDKGDRGDEALEHTEDRGENARGSGRECGDALRGEGGASC